MNARDDTFYLINIYESISLIGEYTRGGREEFFAKRMIQDAVVRNFEIMGGATKQLSLEFREAHPHVPWRRIAGFRDVFDPQLYQRRL